MGGESDGIESIIEGSCIGEFDGIDFVSSQVAGVRWLGLEHVGWGDCRRLAGWERWMDWEVLGEYGRTHC